jgi:hypothetical protein
METTMHKLSLPTSISLIVALGSSAWALDCPVPAKIDDPATAAKIQDLLPADTDLDAPDALQTVVFDLKAAGISDDLILDNLISVRCAAVNAQTGVSDDEKTQQVEAFSQSANDVVFSDVD